MSLPPPAYADNLPLADLGTAELLLTTALRLWSLPHKDPLGRHPDWRPGFVAAGIDDDGIPAFEALFDLVAAAPRRPFDVRCLRCTVLGADEGRLLQLVSLLQHDRPGPAAGILADWLAPAGARMALLPARGLTGALQAGGLVVPLRHLHAVALAELRRAGRADRGFALVQ